MNRVPRDTMATLQLWLPTHLAIADVEDGVAQGSTALPKSWLTPAKADDLGPDTTPRIAVVMPKGTPTPAEDTDHMVWEVEVHGWVSGVDLDNTAELIRRYGKAIATVLRQRLDQVHITRIIDVEFGSRTNPRIIGEVVVAAMVTEQNAWTHADPYRLDQTDEGAAAPGPPADLTVPLEVGVATDSIIDAKDIQW